jgi:hypothetical protein
LPKDGTSNRGMSWMPLSNNITPKSTAQPFARSRICTVVKQGSLAGDVIRKQRPDRFKVMLSGRRLTASHTMGGRRSRGEKLSRSARPGIRPGRPRYMTSRALWPHLATHNG